MEENVAQKEIRFHEQELVKILVAKAVSHKLQSHKYIYYV